MREVALYTREERMDNSKKNTEIIGHSFGKK